ncbi:hypothetical protein JCM8115_005653 [Rhodotorula mucilaginosa]
MASPDGQTTLSSATCSKPLLLELPEEVLEHILFGVSGAEEGFLGDHSTAWERRKELESARAVMLTCKRLVPAATRALYFSPDFYTNFHDAHRSSKCYERSLHRASLFLQNLFDKPELAAMIRNLTDLPMLAAALPTAREISSTASATDRSLAQDVYQCQVLQLATAATSVGVLLTDPENASKVGAVLATRRLSHLRVAYECKMRAPISTFAAFLEAMRSNGDGNAPVFPALQICMSFDGFSERPRRHIDRARVLNYEVIDLDISIEWIDIDQAAYFLPSDIAKLARLRYHLPFELEREPDLDYDLDGFNFDAARLEQRVKHNAIKAFAIESDITYEQEVPFDYYWEPWQYEVPTIDYPLALFGLFPSLEELTLSHGGKMTVEKLELLADTSPNLKVLRLPLTYWTPEQDLHKGDSGETCPFEMQLMATLDRLDSLKVANLGLLPSHSKSPGKAFRRWAKKRKLKVVINWCYDEDALSTGEEFSGNDSSSA